jgi:hypothetical protein
MTPDGGGDTTRFEGHVAMNRHITNQTYIKDVLVIVKETQSLLTNSHSVNY